MHHRDERDALSLLRSTAHSGMIVHVYGMVLDSWGGMEDANRPVHDCPVHIATVLLQS